MEILFLAKKVITFFVEPLGLILTLSFIGLYFLYNSVYTKAKVFLSASILLLFIFSYPPVSNSLIKQLENTHQKYDYINNNIEYIHVLGSGHYDNPKWPLSSQISSTSLKRTMEGISIFKNGTFSSIHYIAKENLHYKNGKNINDRRYNFNFGQSKTIELHDIMLSLKKELNKCDLVIGHGIDNDFTFAKRYLKQQNKLSKNYISDKDCSVVDTYELSKMYRENGYGMQGMLELLDIPHRNLHNGGNDARYNLVMFNAIMETFDDNLKNTFIKTINLLEEEIIELQEDFDSSFKLL